MEKLSVSTQGISQDLSLANGDYDSIERGSMSREQLVSFLQEIMKIAEPDYDSGEDLCPPSVYIEQGDRSVGLFLNEGALCEIETTASVTPFEAVMIATGEKSIEAIDAQKPDAQTVSNADVNAKVPQVTYKGPSFGRKLLAFSVALIPGCVGLSGTVGLARWDSEYSQILVIGVILVTLSFCRLIYTLVRGQGKTGPSR